MYLNLRCLYNSFMESHLLRLVVPAGDIASIITVFVHVFCTMLQQCIIKAPLGALGLNLSRAPWDPYPWVSGVQDHSNAQMGGIRIGDTLLRLNGNDVLGMKISELAMQLHEYWLTGADCVTMMMWRQQPTDSISTADAAEEPYVALHNINKQSLLKFATCLQNIAQLLECPICCDAIKPPSWQCCNGHVLCNNCRNRSDKCPVCRVPLGPRGRCLLSDKLFTLLTDNFPYNKVNTNRRTMTSEHNSLKNTKKLRNEYHNQQKTMFPKFIWGKKSTEKEREQPVETVISAICNSPLSNHTLKTVTLMSKGNEQVVPTHSNVVDTEM